MKEQALKAAIRMLSASPKTSYELTVRLKQKGFSPVIIAQVIEQLKRQSYLDDAAVAKQVLEKLTLIQPSGKKRILLEFKKRGISSELSTPLLAGITEETECMYARQVLHSHRNQLEKLTPAKRKQRIFTLLSQRGFDFNVTRDVGDTQESSEILPDVCEDL